MRVIRSRDAVWVPWKNGGGMTRQIAAFPDSAGYDTFDWRVSIARVDRPAPFSHFEGVDRSLSVLDGRLELMADGAHAVELTSASPPLSFAGDAVIEGIPLTLKVTDFNVMTRRQQCCHEVTRMSIADGTIESIPAPVVGNWTIVHVAAGSVRIDRADDIAELEPGDTIVVYSIDISVTLCAMSACSLIIAQIRRQT